jgi:hypothetical protein
VLKWQAELADGRELRHPWGDVAEEAGDAEWIVEEGVTLYVRVNPVLDAAQPQWFGSSTSGVLSVFVRRAEKKQWTRWSDACSSSVLFKCDRPSVINAIFVLCVVDVAVEKAMKVVRWKLTIVRLSRKGSPLADKRELVVAQGKCDLGAK